MVKATTLFVDTVWTVGWDEFVKASYVCLWVEAGPKERTEFPAALGREKDLFLLPCKAYPTSSLQSLRSQMWDNLCSLRSPLPQRLYNSFTQWLSRLSGPIFSNFSRRYWWVVGKGCEGETLSTQKVIPLARVQWDKENWKETSLLIDTAHIWSSDNSVFVEGCSVHHIILSQMHFY